MVRAQQERFMNLAHEILDKDGLITMKFTFIDLEAILLDEYKNNEFDEVVKSCYNDYYNSDILTRVNRKFDVEDYVIISLGKSDSYDTHEYLGFILSNMLHLNPIKAVVI